MSAPKSVVKTTVKDGKVVCTYTSNLDKTQYYLFELNRAALRDVGSFLRKTFKTEYYNNFHKVTGESGKVTKCKVWSSKSTQYPRLQIGLNASKPLGWWAYFQEVGTSTIKKLGLLQNAVKNNVDTIIQIESQYLSKLSENTIDEMDESDYEDDE